MEFQIQGVSNDWLLLKEEDRGVEFLGNLNLIERHDFRLIKMMKLLLEHN